MLSGLLAAGSDDSNDGNRPNFAQRLVAGLQGANEGYEAWQQKQSQVNSAGKAADYMRKALGDDAEQQMGIADEEWQNMGAREKAAAAQGFQQRQSAAQVAAGIQEQQARAEYYRQRAAPDQPDPQLAAQERLRTMLGNALAPRLPNGAAGPVQAGQGVSPQVAPPDIARMMLQSGVDPRLTLPFLKAGMDAQGGDVMPKPFVTKGGRTVYVTPTGNVVDPDKQGEDVLDTKPKDEEVPDGYQAMRVGKGWTIKPDPSRWATRVEPDPDNPLAQIHSQVLLSKPGKGGGGGPNPPKPTPAPARTATNPKTGEKVVWQDGQWKPVK